MEKNSQTFTYTYSAQQQEEIQNIRKKYLPPEENTMEQLRKLHNSATQKAQTVSLIYGILGALLLGCGMSLVMTDIGAAIGMANTLILGIVIGILGLIPVTLAYPTYNRVLKKERQRIAPEILRLSDELMK